MSDEPPTQASTSSYSHLPVILSLCGGVVILLVIALVAFYTQNQQMKTQLDAKEAELTLLRSKLPDLTTSATTQEATTWQQTNTAYQYTSFLENEMNIAKCMTGKSDYFTVYQYGFQLQQKSNLHPLTCKVDSENTSIYSPGGASDLTVHCSFQKNPFGADRATDMVSDLISTTKLITPITFRLSLRKATLDGTTQQGRTAAGRAYYKTVLTSNSLPTYEYTFFSSKPVNSGLGYTSNEAATYTIILSTYEMLAENRELDNFVGNLIDRVSFVNLDEPSNRCLIQAQ